MLLNPYSVVAAICAPVYLIYLPSLKPTDRTSTVISKLSNIDWIGAILSTGAMASFAIVFTFAGSSWTWDNARTIAMIAVFVSVNILPPTMSC